MRAITDTVESSGKWTRKYLGLDNYSGFRKDIYKRRSEAARESIINYLGFDWVDPAIYENVPRTPNWALKHLSKKLKHS